MEWFYFSASWCKPCETALPRVKHLAKIYGAKLEVVDVGTEAGQRKARELLVTALPTLLILRGGKILRSFTGSTLPEQLEQFLRVLSSRY